jgi:hypothetical protein
LAYADETLDQALGALDRLRKGWATSLEDVERLGQQMLKDYSAAEDQGRIYYQLAHTHAQTGITIKAKAERVIEYAQKGLACPLDPVRRLRLYSYWASALQVGDRSKPLTETRKPAAIVLLNGLKEAQQYKIPERQPPESSGVAPLLIGPPPDRPSPWYEAARKEAERRRAIQKQHHLDWELWLCHKVLTDQVVDSYRQLPHAASELRELATSILGDQKTVDLLMSRLKDLGALEDE